MAKQRSQIINDALDMITRNYPGDLKDGDNLKLMSDAIENFFLTDHCEEEESDDDAPSTPTRNSITNPMKRLTTGKKHRKDRTAGSGIAIMDGIGNLFGNSKDEPEKAAEKKEVTFTSPVVPRSKKTRRSIVVRAADEEMLQASARDLVVDDDSDGGESPAKSAPAPAPAVKSSGSPIGAFFANNPYAVVVVVAVVLGVLRRAQFKTITMDSDLAMLISFTCFCFGLNWPRPVHQSWCKSLRHEQSVAERLLLRPVPALPHASSCVPV